MTRFFLVKEEPNCVFLFTLLHFLLYHTFFITIAVPLEISVWLQYNS